MLESFNTKKEEMKYQRLSPVEQEQRGILGRLVGPMADSIDPTRNGRRYTAELWEKVFADPIMKEKIQNRCLFGELGHPLDRQEIDMEKIAICLAEVPKMGDDGKLYGVFDILATPNGRILKTLCDYGCNIGVSSRGSGDTFEDAYGVEIVDPETYECECWDAVLLPAVLCARPKYVTESLEKKKTLKSALLEELQNSSDTDKTIMENTLNELNIDLDEKSESEESIDSETPANIDNSETKNETAGNSGEQVLVEELHKSLSTQRELEEKIKELQKKLSVCYTKEARYSSKIESLSLQSQTQTKLNKQLAEEVESLKKQNSSLNEQVGMLTDSVNNNVNEIKQLKESVSSYRTKCTQLQSQVSESKSTKTSLNENLNKKSAEVKKLTEAYETLEKTSTKKLNEALRKTKELENQNKKLVEELHEAKKDHQIFRSQSTAKLEKTTQLVEKYKNVAKTAVDRYITSQATRIGVSSAEIRNRLSESYSFKDIDKVVEDLQQYKLNLNSLPFTTLTDVKNTKMRIRESKEPLLEMHEGPSQCFDDDVDDSLLSLTN